MQSCEAPTQSGQIGVVIFLTEAKQSKHFNKNRATKHGGVYDSE